MLWYELTRWWAYRRIAHPKMRLYVWLIPMLMAVSLTATVLSLPIRPAITGTGGVLSAIISILAILPGFFLAALAAVSTFQRPEMDVEMPSPAPTVKLRFEGEVVAFEVTRRMFLSYLFSYLSVVTLVLVVLCAGANFAAPSVAYWLKNIESVQAREAFEEILRGGLLLFVAYWCASILITTLHGIFFLTERMHQPD